MIIKKALIIDSPWIEKILAGDKIWEMRSTRSSHRGHFGLIQKGSGRVIGIANLDNVSGPYNNKELEKYFRFHHVGAALYEREDYKWRYAWELSSAKKLRAPVNYRHKNGAVTWVDLDDNCTREISQQLSEGTPARNSAEVATELESDNFDSNEKVKAGFRVPIARDGSIFSVECRRGGVFTVGEKGDEQRIDNFYEALKHLQSMPTAKWRRPNPKGNWGIVSAIDWVTPENHKATSI